MARVALIPSAYMPSLGGVEELTRNLARTLVIDGHEVEIWTNRHGAADRPKAEQLDGIAIRRFDLPLPSANLKSVLRSVRGSVGTLRELRRAVRDFRPDVLHVQCFGSNGIYATALSMITRVPLVVTLQGETRMDDSDIYETSKVFRTGLRWGMRRAVMTTGCSKFTLDDARERFGLPTGAGEVVFNGVDLSTPPVHTVGEESIRPNSKYVLAVGRVVHKKGFDLLIEAWATICDRHPDTVLAIAGSGPGLDSLHNLVNRLSIGSHVRFLGRATRHQVADLMAGTSCFVMPSRLEPFGIVILEAWRSGAAVVCSNVGGPPEFVEHERTGLLVDPTDRAQLATAIDRVLSDSVLVERLQRDGLAAVHGFDWPVIADDYEGIYDRAIATKSATAGRRLTDRKGTNTRLSPQ